MLYINYIQKLEEKKTVVIDFIQNLLVFTLNTKILLILFEMETVDQF